MGPVRYPSSANPIYGDGGHPSGIEFLGEMRSWGRQNAVLLGVVEGRGGSVQEARGVCIEVGREIRHGVGSQGGMRRLTCTEQTAALLDRQRSGTMRV